jgi:hypothetical protein
MRPGLNTTIIVATFSIALFVLTSLAIGSSPHLERAVLLSESVRSASPLEASEALDRHEDVRSFIVRGGELEEATSDEKSHLIDVRRLMHILIGTAFLLIAIGIGAMRRTTLGYRAILRKVSLSVIGTIIVLGLVALLTGFESFFWNFHFIFFPQGNFSFAQDSYLISLYPRVFFAHMTAWTAGLTITVMGLIYTLSRE